MSKVSQLIQSFEEKIKNIEQAIANAANQAAQWTNNHHSLVGMLNATKDNLSEVQKVLDFVAPTSQ